MPGTEIVVSKVTIKNRQTLSDSIMPTGLLDNLRVEDRRDLIAYLMNPNQIGK
jgi:hypothetical protein